MLGYVYLGGAILLEFLGTTAMKLSDGFSHAAYAIVTLVCYGLCFCSLSLSLKTIDLNIAYATWGGLGIILATTVSYFYFHENITPLGLLGIVLIIIGVILCNIFGTGH
ncbi:multidrug efflux SMR transporter [uncultured Selenomonas sp.]|uniref:DMT family transporter n=1 Tax=uncultured Selenomonas sp. TaxID=159275 RepID=UPI0025E536B8|nr:multidrug efflux SMR transporter [uncultured Selenomonas sp.]